MLWENYAGDDSQPAITTDAAGVKQYSLDTIQFEIPENWSADASLDQAGRVDTMLDSVAFLPGEKLPTIYGDGTEYFHVYVSVFQNRQNLNAQQWLEMDAGSNPGGLGLVMDGEVESTQKINGHEAYFKKITSGGYEEVHYVLRSGDKIAHVSARTYEVDESIPGRGDFRLFESSIEALVKTISFK